MASRMSEMPMQVVTEISIFKVTHHEHVYLFVYTDETRNAVVEWLEHYARLRTYNLTPSGAEVAIAALPKE